MKDNEIIYEMQRIIAMLEDGHSSVLFETDSIFPIYYEAIEKDGVMRYYAVNVPKEQKELAFSYLESINNIPVEEIIDRFCSYISADSEVWKQKKIFDSLNYGWIMQTEALQIIGVLKENDDSAEFCFVKEDGTKFI